MNRFKAHKVAGLGWFATHTDTLNVGGTSYITGYTTLKSDGKMITGTYIEDLMEYSGTKFFTSAVGALAAIGAYDNL